LPFQERCIQHFRYQQNGHILPHGLPQEPSSLLFHGLIALCHYYGRSLLSSQNLQVCRRLYCQLRHLLLLCLCERLYTYADITTLLISTSYKLLQDSHTALHIYPIKTKLIHQHTPRKCSEFFAFCCLQFQYTSLCSYVLTNSEYRFQSAMP